MGFTILVRQHLYIEIALGVTRFIQHSFFLLKWFNNKIDLWYKIFKNQKLQLTTATLLQFHFNFPLQQHHQSVVKDLSKSTALNTLRVRLMIQGTHHFTGLLGLTSFLIPLPTVFIVMMTAWHRNTFHITGPLWGESTGDRWITLTKGQLWGALVFLLLI